MPGEGIECSLLVFVIVLVIVFFVSSFVLTRATGNRRSLHPPRHMFLMAKRSDRPDSSDFSSARDRLCEEPRDYDKEYDKDYGRSFTGRCSPK